MGVVCLGAIGWWRASQAPAEPRVGEVSAEEAAIPSARPVVAATPVPSIPTGSLVPPAAASGEEVVAAIIAAPDLSEKAAVAKLFEAMPQLDARSQSEAAEHIANLSDDAEARQWSQRVIAWDLPEPAAEVLYQQLNNRPLEVLYPVLGAIADDPKHPKRQETLEALSVLSDPPPVGTTWSQWLQTKLKAEANP